MLLGSFGYLLPILHNISSSKHWYVNDAKQYEFAIVKLVSDLEPKAKSYKINAEVVQLVNGQDSKSTQGEAILYLSKGDTIPNLHQGDFLLVKNKFKDIQHSGNPGSFDYGAYCRNNNIYQSSFLKDHEWKQLSKHETSLSSIFNQGNRNTRSILQSYISDSSILGIAEALLIGYRKDVDQEIWQAYSNTGIVHIIAISGLHMAMVYATVRWLLLLIPFFKKRKIIAILFALLFMWGFAALTGLPPSVTRAAVMFTAIGIGEITGRKIAIYNNLAASAFILLCFNPLWIIDVGFQLSYLALLSIVLFYTPVYNWLYFSFKIPDAIWKLIAGTISAQILTFPLCVYYFHQFPLLFIITNLVAVPASTIILYLEILLVAFHWITPLAKILGQFISWLIHLLNEFVFLIGKLSFAVWDGLNINILQFILLFLCVIIFSIWLMHKKSRWLLPALSSALLLSFTFLIQEWNILHQHKLVVYNINKESYIQFIAGHDYFSPDTLQNIQPSNSELFIFKPGRTSMFLKNDNPSIVNSLENNAIQLYDFHSKIIARIRSSNLIIPQPISVDYLILSKGFKADSALLFSYFKPKQLILDSSIPFWEITKYKTAFQHVTIPVHYVSEHGAFTCDL
jgi:competence protein ComEC